MEVYGDVTGVIEMVTVDGIRWGPTRMVKTMKEDSITNSHTVNDSL